MLNYAFTPLLGLAVCLTVSGVAVRAADRSEIAPQDHTQHGIGSAKGASLIQNGDFAEPLKAGDSKPGSWVSIGSAVTTATLEPPVGGCQRMARLDSYPAPGSAPWNTLFLQRCITPMRKGDAIYLRAWLRSPDGCPVCFVFESGRDGHKFIERVAALTPEWKEYRFMGRADRDLQPGESQVNFFLGYKQGLVEMTGVRVENHGPAPDSQFDQTIVQPLKPEDLVPREVPPERPRLEPPLSLFSKGDGSQESPGRWAAVDPKFLKLAVVDVEAGPYRQALRLECVQTSGDLLKAALQQTCVGAIRRGDAVYFRAWLRSPDGSSVRFVWKMNNWPHRGIIDQLVWIGPQWKEYRLLGRADRELRSGETTLNLIMGYKRGVVEVAGVRLENFGGTPSTAFDQTIDFYRGRAHPDTWRGPALERIERLRKGDLKIQVLDAAGKPVPGAAIHVQQQRHHFRFGSAVPAARLVDTKDPDNLRFQQEVLRLFNTVTFDNDLKWEQKRPATRRTADEAVKWLQAHDIALRGHTLMWGSWMFMPSPANKLRGDALLRACREHVADYAAWMRGKVYVWDVVNEAVTSTEMWDEIGWDKFADVYRWTRAADPEALLSYNEYNIVQENAAHRAKAAERIRFLLKQNAPLDLLGIQGHMSVPLTPIDRVLEFLDEWAAFGKDLEITEFDVGCRDDRAHAEYVRDFMTAMFSHPKVQAFIMWGFWEGSLWRAKDGAAMFRRDWSKRPALEAWEDLVLRQWWTSASATTGPDGTVVLRAYYGKHQVTAEAGGERAAATLELTPGKAAGAVLQLKK